MSPYKPDEGTRILDCTLSSDVIATPMIAVLPEPRDIAAIGATPTQLVIAPYSKPQIIFFDLP